MASINFSSLVGTTTAFDAAADELVLTGSASGYRFTQSGANVVVTNASNQSVTLTGVTLSALVNGTNVSADTSAVIVGDDTSSTTADASGNTINITTDADYETVEDSDNLVMGLGGGDTLTVGNGDNVIIGGSGVVDTTDGADVIVAGAGDRKSVV